MCGYRGYYTNQAMEYFGKSRLHTEAKENRRKPRQQAELSSSNNHGDDGNPADSVDGTVDGNHGTFSSTEVNGPASDDQAYIVEDNYTTSSDELSDIEDYTYYNPKDSRRWTEE